MTISVVVPLYNEESNVAPLVERIVTILASIPDRPEYEIVLVNDGSSDGTLAAIRNEMRARPHIVLINLSRNFGHQLAATAGLELASGEAVVLMDGDLQDPPELIAAFVERWRDKVEKVTNARERNMLRVILGETLEAKRFFDQMIAGREDLLGRRDEGAGTPGEVIATRWVGGL